MALKKLEWWDQYKIADESTDIRGWKLLDRTGHCMGEITDLIFEDAGCRVLYAVTDIATRKVLVPVGVLALDEEKRQAVTQSMTMEDIDRLTGYTGADTLDEEAERRHYQDYRPEADAGRSIDYAGHPYTLASPRFGRIEERLRRHRDVHARETTFAGTEPTDEDDRAGGMWR